MASPRIGEVFANSEGASAQPRAKAIIARLSICHLLKLRIVESVQREATDLRTVARVMMLSEFESLDLPMGRADQLEG